MQLALIGGRWKINASFKIIRKSLTSREVALIFLGLCM